MSAGACTAAFVALIMGGQDHPPMSYALPWAIGPLVGAPPGALAGLPISISARACEREEILARSRPRGHLAPQVGPRARPAAASRLARNDGLHPAELFTVWVAMVSFGYHMPGSGVVLGYGVGYVISRWAAPPWGGGLIDVMLILALQHAGAPLAVTVIGVFTYRFFNLRCWFPVSLAAFSSVRRFTSGSGMEDQDDGALPPPPRRPFCSWLWG